MLKSEHACRHARHLLTVWVLTAVARELEEAAQPSRILALELLGCAGPAGPDDRAFAVAVLSSSLGTTQQLDV